MKSIYTIILLICLSYYSIAQEFGIMNNSKSTFAQLKSINIGDCKWTNGFWADKFKICEEAMVPYMGNLLCGDTGHALNNFKIAAGITEGKFAGMRWHDGDFYKWLEAAIYVYAQNRDKNLLKDVDGYIEIIGKAQMEDGYIQTQEQLRDDIDRFANRRNHEMYNCGHLFTAACIHHRITGQSNFLNIAIKQADLLYTIFYPETKQYGRFGFNQTQIMGLVELYRTTRNIKYLKLAEKFVDRRGKYPVEEHPSTRDYPIGDMVQERTPLRESSEAVGHAVLALYFYAGAADIYAETGEKALIDALDKLWENITHKKMYVTGAVGQAHFGVSSNGDRIQEGFTDEYSMPNLTAYNETCANICNAMFNYRMLSLTGQPKHIDVIEKVIYNSALSGIGLDGKDYFYSNPLRMIRKARDFSGKKDATELECRAPYLDCFCCPPNLVRTIAQLSGWAYSLTTNGVSVNLYGGNELNTKLLDGSVLKLKQESNYPWSGLVKITIDECKYQPFDLWIRIPEWAEGSVIKINNKVVDAVISKGQFVKINRQWHKGDIITIELPMDVELIEGHSRIEEVRNQAAIKRGPVVYCLESPDLPDGANFLDVYLPADGKFVTEYKPGFLGGVMTIKGKTQFRSMPETGMYHKIENPKWTSQMTQFIPYFAWSNRGVSEMTVFLPVVWNLK
ncbi:MAG: beta-L-arabinofuranosidase domain-containing protein [Saprospiraceae bacterium]